ncbi:MAG: hypothetical protein AAGJ81_10745 [Verrucomicrobiota bacterium]
MSEDLSEILLHTPQSIMDEPDPRDHLPNMSRAAANLSIDEMLAMPGLGEFGVKASNQGRRSSCTLHAGVNGIDMLYGRFWPGEGPSGLSREGAYNAIRNHFGRLDKDEGMTSRQMMEGMKEVGLRSSSFWEPDSVFEAPPADYKDSSIKLDLGYYKMPTFTDEAGQFAPGTNYSLRMWLQWIKLERLPIWVSTKIPVGDMRSSQVRRTGIRGQAFYRSRNEPGYWHREVVENLSRFPDSRIMVTLLGSWDEHVGDRGRFHVPWENFLNRYYTGQNHAPKKGLA